MKDEIIDRFVESWGEMGTVWGLNSSMARVHALLIVSEEPLSLDFISKRLKISRGNASMSLKELRAWGVVHRGGSVDGSDIARPAVFLVDDTGIIRWRNLTENWRVRTRPERILQALDRQQGRRPPTPRPAGDG